jgi:hypothetical protein
MLGGRCVENVTKVVLAICAKEATNLKGWWWLSVRHRKFFYFFTSKVVA